ncbi:uncharacterized protein LOC131248540 [Magnolia sinica]|uniref:uncharacterized protein LOC131248540 n=1 Tax=Magnolia sinica TaxID=86752 RepID=UPI002659A218|nr:uncharacterized protein LOC131248540 [Magnolia sinica]
MDLLEMGDFNGFWTNEKHISFLNRIEASFVRKMLENEDDCLLTYAHGALPSHRHDYDHHHRPRLDRYLPDSAESTLDFEEGNNRGKTRVIDEIVGRSGTCDVREDGEKTRKGSYRPYNASQDQVVPQLAHLKTDRDEERGVLEIAVPRATERD